MATSAEDRVELRRRFAATPQQVFARFADASLVARWLSPAPEITLTVLQLDFRKGGSYRFAYGLPDGRTVMVGGVYQAIEPPSRIVFSWTIEPPDEHAGIESHVTVTIKREGGGSELTIRHERLLRIDAVTRHRDGWHGALDRLTGVLESKGSSHGL
jgi:uncharacterized protein YndB with AHSA1/START domain